MHVFSCRFSRHPSLLAIGLSMSSKQHPESALRWRIIVFSIITDDSMLITLVKTSVIRDLFFESIKTENLLYTTAIIINISITKGIQYIYKYRRTLLFQVRTVYQFLASVHGDSRRETQFLKVYANHTMLIPPQRAAHLVMFKISIYLSRSRFEKLDRMPQR